MSHALSVPKSSKKQRTLQKGGGYKAIATADAQRITALIRKVTIGFHNPYVLPLSAPSNKRVAESGLLTQQPPAKAGGLVSYGLKVRIRVG